MSVQSRWYLKFQIKIQIFQRMKIRSIFPQKHFKPPQIKRNNHSTPLTVPHLELASSPDHDHHLFLTSFAKKNRIEKPQDWYSIHTQQIFESQGKYPNSNSSHFLSGGSSLLEKYGTLSQALITLFPNEQWQTWRFKLPPKNFSSDVNAHRNFFLHHFFQINDITIPEDLYQTTTNDMSVNAGHRILYCYHLSVSSCIVSTFPELRWQLFRFCLEPQGVWEDFNNQVDCVGYLKERLGIKRMEEWYNVSVERISEVGGNGLLRHFYWNLGQLLYSVYPDYRWKLWLFSHSKVPHEYFESEEMIQEYFEWLEGYLEILTPEDWLKLSSSKLTNLPASDVFLKLPLIDMLRKYMAEIMWDMKDFKEVQKMHERTKKFLQKVFTSYELVEFYESRTYKGNQTLNFYFPEFNLGFVCLESHYFNRDYCFGKPSNYREEKGKLIASCEALGITIIQLPHWWAASNRLKSDILDDLKATIHQCLPTFFKDESEIGNGTAIDIKKDRNHSPCKIFNKSPLFEKEEEEKKKGENASNTSKYVWKQVR